jgi:hypothetical protein
MSIIYSYPEQGALNANDLLIGTSATKVGGKQKNITRNFSVQQIADFINRGAGFVDPVATDFQIPVFNQSGTKITGSIMSQDTFPNGTGITIAGALATTGSISTTSDLSAFGAVTLGSQNNLISLNSTTKLGGPIQDASGTLGNVNQILLSNSSGNVSWANYEAGLTYEGTWNAANNTTNGLSNSPALVSGIGVSGHFYIVNVAGNTTLDTNSDWHVGDWAVFLDQGGQPAAWQKIDNTSALVGSGTAGTLSKWTDATTLNDSLVSEAGTVVSVNGILKVNDTVESTVTNSNLKLQGNGTGAVEVRGFGGVTGTAGRIQLNCSNNNHGVSIESPPHSAGATYTLALPINAGSPGQVLTTDAAATPSQLSWASPSVGTGTANTLTMWGNTPSLIVDSIMSQDSSATVATIAGGLNVTGTIKPATITDSNNLTGAPGQVLTSISPGAILEWQTLSISGTGSLNAIPRFSDNAGTLGNSIITQNGAGNRIVVSGEFKPTQITDVNNNNGSAGEFLGKTGSSLDWLPIPASGVQSVVTGNALEVFVDNTDTANPAISVVTGAVGVGGTSLATGDQIQTAIDLAVVGSLQFKGSFNATTGAIDNSSPATNLTAATRVAITVGDYYVVSVDGDFFGDVSEPLTIGDQVIATATVAADTSVISNFSIVATNVGIATTTTAGIVSVPTTGGISVDAAGAVSLPSVSSPGTFNSATVTVDANGHISAVAAGAGGAFTQWSLSGNTGTAQIITQAAQSASFVGGIATAVNDATGTNAGILTTATASGILDINLRTTGGTPSNQTFYRGDGEWAQAGSASVVTVRSSVATASQQLFDLGAEPSGSSRDFVDLFIDGVYQAVSSYTVTNSAGGNTGTLDYLQLVAPGAPLGVTIETKTTSGSTGAGVTTVNGQTGAIVLPNKFTGNVINASTATTTLVADHNLYVLTGTGIATLQLPNSPSDGDSIKISNISGLATNIVAQSSVSAERIMGVAANMTLDSITAAFELVYCGSANPGWVVIGAK